jgi:hypothetical protein
MRTCVTRHPITLTVSTGRAGTTFLYETFKQNYPTNGSFSHELLHAMVVKPALYHRPFDQETKQKILAEPIIQDLIRQWRAKAEAGPVVDFGWTMCPLVPVLHGAFGDQLRVLVIHRHPISAAASIATMGSYWDFDHVYYALSPMHARVRFPHYAQRWSRMSPFEKCLFRWMEATAYGEELCRWLPAEQWMVVSFEDLINSDSTLEAIARFLGFDVSQPLVRAQENNAIRRHSLERYPVGNEWRRYVDFPEVLDYAHQLEYNMEIGYLERLVRNYQLPPGLLPYIRNVTRFWKWRSRAGIAIRKLGLRREYPDKARMIRQLKGQLYPTDVTS